MTEVSQPMKACCDGRMLQTVPVGFSFCQSYWQSEAGQRAFRAWFQSAFSTPFIGPGAPPQPARIATRLPWSRHIDDPAFFLSLLGSVKHRRKRYLVSVLLHTASHHQGTSWLWGAPYTGRQLQILAASLWRSVAATSSMNSGLAPMLASWSARGRIHDSALRGLSYW